MEDYDFYNDVPEEDYDAMYADELEMMNELEELNNDVPEKIQLPGTKLKENLENPSFKSTLNGDKNSFHEPIYKADKRKRDFDPSLDLYLSDESDDNEGERNMPGKEIVPKKMKYGDQGRSLIETNYERKRVFSIPPFGKDTITVTNTDGKRVFLCLSKRDWFSKDDCNVFSSKYNLQLLSKPYEDIKSAVEEKRRTEAMERVEALSAMLQEDNDSDPMAVTSADQVVPHQEEKLWVEKYSPKSFQDLLSDDGTNRTLLRWIKLWDGVVFGKDMKVKNPGTHQKQENADEKSFKGKYKKPWDHSDDLVLDGTGAPKFKLALLCGNPGLGKTTLAHVIAYHAGYNAVEMNASDDRSPEIFRNKLENAMQMKAVMGEDKRPNCLIIDEIDGAPSPAINLLVQAAKDAETDFKVKGKKKSRLSINRPVICICNNQYATALRQLRQNAFVLNFPATNSGKLVQRLLEITRKERMRADMATLLSLCDKSENDIRSCINTLQFVRSKHTNLTFEHLQEVDVGQKDMKCGVFDFTREVFQQPKSRKKASKFARQMQDNVLEGQGEDTGKDVKSTSSSRFHYILHLAYSVTEYEKMIQSIHDNFPNSRAKDPRLDSMVNGTEWLQFVDSMDKLISSYQLFTLWKYYPFVPVAFHMMLSSPLAPKLSFVNSSFELNMKKSRSIQTLTSVVQDVSPGVRKNLSEGIAMMETIPYLFNILTPYLRPVNIQLYSDNEKKELITLISTMISYNLTYRQEKSFDGQYSYILEPNVEEVLIYPGQPQHKHLTYASKQMIAREIELEKMRRSAAAASERQSRQIVSGKAKETKVVLQLEPVKLKKENKKVTRDFFGRIVKPKETSESSTQSNDAAKEASLINSKVWFRFNEGFTNAVRRPVKVNDFL